MSEERPAEDPRAEEAPGGDATAACLLCTPTEADAAIGRSEVWADRLWRLTTAVAPGTVLAFSYLEPRRHIPSIAELDGDEARTFGSVLAHCCKVLTEETGAERTFVYVFGGSVPHLHAHLTPHREGDALNTSMLRGEVREVQRPDGLVDLESVDFEDLPAEEMAAAADRIRRRLASDPPPADDEPLTLLPFPAAPRPGRPDPFRPERPPWWPEQPPEPPDDPWRRPIDPWAGD